jgi:CDGSH-type Zn-finger protein
MRIRLLTRNGHENRKHETRFVDLERAAGRNLGGAAQINADSSGHARALADGRQRTSLCRAGADPIRDHPVHRLVIGVPRFLL